MLNMGSHVAFVKSKRYTPAVNTQLDHEWQKHGHMGSQKAFGSKLSVWPAGCLHLGMVKLSPGPPVWLAQVPHMGLHNGRCCVNEVVELRLSPPSAHHGTYLVLILLVVVVDKAVCVGLPSPLDCQVLWTGLIPLEEGLLGPL